MKIILNNQLESKKGFIDHFFEEDIRGFSSISYFRFRFKKKTIFDFPLIIY